MNEIAIKGHFPLTKKKLELACIPSPDDFEMYSRAVLQIPNLTEEEEKECAILWHKNKDKNAVKELVASHLKFVVKVVSQHKNYGVSLGDLIQEGNVGLMKAVQKFDPFRGVRLSVYAIKWIEAEIREFIFKNFKIVRLSASDALRKLFFGLRKNIAELKKEGEVRTIDAKAKAWLSNRIGVSEEEVDEALGYFQSGEALSLCLENSSDDSSEADPVRVEPREAGGLSWDGWKPKTPDNEVFQLTPIINWGEEKKCLDKREAKVIEARFGLGEDEKSETLQKLSKKMCISLERVRQIQKSGVEKLKRKMSFSVI